MGFLFFVCFRMDFQQRSFLFIIVAVVSLFLTLSETRLLALIRRASFHMKTGQKFASPFCERVAGAYFERRGWRAADQTRLANCKTPLKTLRLIWWSSKDQNCNLLLCAFGWTDLVSSSSRNVPEESARKSSLATFFFCSSLYFSTKDPEK